MPPCSIRPVTACGSSRPRTRFSGSQIAVGANRCPPMCEHSKICPNRLGESNFLDSVMRFRPKVAQHASRLPFVQIKSMGLEGRVVARFGIPCEFNVPTTKPLLRDEHKKVDNGYGSTPLGVRASRILASCSFAQIVRSRETRVSSGRSPHGP